MFFDAAHIHTFESLQDCETVRLWVLKCKYESSKKVQAFKTQITQKWESQMLFRDDIIRSKFSKMQIFGGTILNPTLSVWVLLLQRVTFTGYCYLVRPLDWVNSYQIVGQSARNSYLNLSIFY